MRTYIRETFNPALTGAALRAHMAGLEAALIEPKEVVGPLESLGGLNVVLKGMLSNGLEFVFKPLDGENQSTLDETRPVWRLQLGDVAFAAREVAGYAVDRCMEHYARVLPTLQVEIDGRRGIIAPFVEGTWPGEYSSDNMTAEFANRPGDISLMKEPMRSGGRRLAVFDNNVGNIDRHGGNFLSLRDTVGT